MVPTSGRRTQLTRCLDALKQQSYQPTEISVIHDGSNTEGVRDAARHAGATYTRGSGLGVVSAYNIGLRRSTGDVVAFVDDDALPDNDWVHSLVTCYSPGVGAVGGRIIAVRDEDQDAPTQVGKVSPNGKIIGNFDYSGRLLLVDHLKGTNMSFAKDATHKTGMFDENYGGDGFRFEADYCMRLKRKGFSIVYNPKAVVWHEESSIRGVPRGHSRVRFYYHRRNDTYFALRNCMQGANSGIVLGRILGRSVQHMKRALLTRDLAYVFGLAGFASGTFQAFVASASLRPRDVEI